MNLNESNLQLPVNQLLNIRELQRLVPSLLGESNYCIVIPELIQLLEGENSWLCYLNQSINTAARDLTMKLSNRTLWMKFIGTKHTYKAWSTT